jgi:predicted dehydrogenase
MKRIDRRKFLQTAGAASASFVAMTATSTSQAQAPASGNDRPNIGCIGVGGRGAGISKTAAQFGDIVAVCDVDLAHAESFQARVAPQAEIYQDYRHLLDRKDIDVVIQGAPDHWHTKINIDALQAGKDVYGEKPLTLTIEEAKQLRRVVAETGRVFQTGTQQRSERQFQTAVELVRNGRIGQLQQVRVALPYYSTKGGPFPEEPIPTKLDWDAYQGQAPEHYYTHHRCHKIFRWWYEYAGGIITDWGNHHVDIAHWAMNCEDTGPVEVEARGLFPNADHPQAAECYNTPDRFFSRMQFANGMEVLFYSALGDQRIYGEVEPCEPVTREQVAWLFGIGDVPDEVKQADRNGVMLIGDKGRIFVNRGGVYGAAADELKENPLPADAWRVRPSRNHMGNFFACVKSREKPAAPAEVEARTVTSCHLTNISLRLGRKIRWDPQREEIVGDDEARGMQSREQREPYTIDT